MYLSRPLVKIPLVMNPVSRGAVFRYEDIRAKRLPGVASLLGADLTQHRNYTLKRLPRISLADSIFRAADQNISERETIQM